MGRCITPLKREKATYPVTGKVSGYRGFRATNFLRVGLAAKQDFPVLLRFSISSNGILNNPLAKALSRAYREKSR